MPRRARIDFEGVENLERSRKALHHVMVRGLERREIFQDAQDRESFLNARSRGHALVCEWRRRAEAYVRVGARLGISRQ